MRRFAIATAVALLVTAGAGVVLLRGLEWRSSPWSEGTQIAELDGVPVYDNGPLFVVSHGRHYAPDGYYFGQKWQCVEFVKRFLYQARGHRMPEVMGHAVSYFDSEIAHGRLNRKRGMIQFAVGRSERPRSGDLIVSGGAGGYGHVGIVASSSSDFVEVVQQNKAPSRQRFRLVSSNDGGVTLAESDLPVLGWLRLPATDPPMRSTP